MAHHRAYLFCKRMWTVCIAQIRGDLLSVAAGRTNFGDDRIRFLFTAAVVNQHLCALLGQRKRTSPADAA